MTLEFAEKEMERRALALGRSFYVYQIESPGIPPAESYIVTGRELDGREPVATFEQ